VDNICLKCPETKPDRRQADHAEPGQPMARSREADKAASNLCQRPQVHCANDQTDENQEQARETFADPTQVKAHADDPTRRTKRYYSLDKPADRRRLSIVERNTAQARPADSQRNRQHHDQEPGDDGRADYQTGDCLQQRAARTPVQKLLISRV
jgi:hypothetical protein